jgi:hypothetical protein
MVYKIRLLAKCNILTALGSNLSRGGYPYPLRDSTMACKIRLLAQLRRPAVQPKLLPSVDFLVLAMLRWEVVPAHKFSLKVR